MEAEFELPRLSDDTYGEELAARYRAAGWEAEYRENPFRNARAGRIVLRRPEGA